MWGWATLVSMALAADVAHVRGGLDLVPPPGLGLRAADCAPCHADEVAEWSGSRHAVAATNPIFQASWRHWPNGWCLGCHVPDRQGQVALLGAPAVPGVQRPPLAEPVSGAWEDGVGCAVCHISEGAIVTASAPSEAALDAHPMKVEPSLTSPERCATCHEFPFQLHTPGPFTYGGTPAQETITEWSSSSAAARGEVCVTCHMPAGAHSFPGAHDQALVRSALDVEVARHGGRVVARVSGDPPHRVPSGDPFRRIELHVCGPAGCSDPVASGILRRRYRTDAQSWTLYADTALSPEHPRRRLVIPDDPAATRWELWYRYGERRFERALPADEVGYVIFSGDLAPKAHAHQDPLENNEDLETP